MFHLCKRFMRKSFAISLRLYDLSSALRILFPVLQDRRRTATGVRGSVSALWLKILARMVPSVYGVQGGGILLLGWLLLSGRLSKTLRYTRQFHTSFKLLVSLLSPSDSSRDQRIVGCECFVIEHIVPNRAK